jgi:F-type H+-transporting ATPase subunit gamma
MGAAEQNVKQRLEEIRSQYHHRRQNAITSELLDVISGFEAMTGTADDSSVA